MKRPFASVHLHAEGPHEGRRDADVGPFFPALGVERDGSLCVGSRHQQPADKLAALTRRDARLPAADAASLYGQGNLPCSPA